MFKTPIFLLLLSLALAGCGNYTATTRQARDDFYAGKYSDAAKSLEKGAHEDGVDQLLFLFDRATALHQASDYEESNRDFHLADKLSEIKDYTSLSAEAVTLITNDKIIPYKGEDFEKVLISQYLALNYLMLGKHEDALVECRRVNHKLHMMITQGKRKYKLNPMAHYLAALLYEDQGEWNDAFVDYQAVYKLMPELPYLREDLYRLALRNKIFDQEFGTKKWVEVFKLSADDEKRIRSTLDDPEVVVIVENGSAPEKAPHPSWKALPHYVPRFNPVSYVEVKLKATEPKACAFENAGQSKILFDVEAAAIQNLDEKYGPLIAKRIAGVVVKEVVADQVSKRTDPVVGAILRIGMHMADQADLRSWLTLPKNFQIYRVRVPLGAESLMLQIRPKSAINSDAQSATPLIEKIVHFAKDKPRQRQFVHVRIL